MCCDTPSGSTSTSTSSNDFDCTTRYLAASATGPYLFVRTASGCVGLSTNCHGLYFSASYQLALYLFIPVDAIFFFFFRGRGGGHTACSVFLLVFFVLALCEIFVLFLFRFRWFVGLWLSACGVLVTSREIWRPLGAVLFLCVYVYIYISYPNAALVQMYFSPILLCVDGDETRNRVVVVNKNQF